MLRTHDEAPAGAVREVLRLLDEEPALDEDLLKLGRWIAAYYCAPLGQTLRAMTPLSGEVRHGKIYSLTTAGRDVARQLYFGENDEDPATQVLRLLDTRPSSAPYLTRKITSAVAVLRSLEKKGFVEAEDVAAERDPLRAGAARLRVEFAKRAGDLKLPKSERELLSYLELHPGTHRLTEVDKIIAKASVAARSLARRELAKLTSGAGDGRFDADARPSFAESASAGGVRTGPGGGGGKTISDLSVAGRHGIREDGDLSAGD